MRITVDEGAWATIYIRVSGGGLALLLLLLVMLWLLLLVLAMRGLVWVGTVVRSEVGEEG